MSTVQMAQLVLQRLARAHPDRVRFLESPSSSESLQRKGWVDAGRHSVRRMQLVRHCERLLALDSEVLVSELDTTGARVWVRLPGDSARFDLDEPDDSSGAWAS